MNYQLMRPNNPINLIVRPYRDSDRQAWDDFVMNHPKSNVYHLSGWMNVIRRAYGKRPFYLVAVDEGHSAGVTSDPDRCTRLKGIFPLFHLKHVLFGNSLVSMPYFDIGGILANDASTERALLDEAFKLGQELRVDHIELRHTEPLSWLVDSPQATHSDCKLSAMSYTTRSHKVRMLLELPETADALMKSFKSKLRSQINKPMKEGLTTRVGGEELIDDFYRVFAINMRDLGSPVHSKSFIQEVLREFGESARIVLVHKEFTQVACSLMLGFKDILENPWASALRKYSRLAPNMLLYWCMLEYACNQSYRYFDFGRSSPDEGTYRFKKQWGALPRPLHWYYIPVNGSPDVREGEEKQAFEKAIKYWQKIPVQVTRILGPVIRKHISL